MMNRSPIVALALVLMVSRAAMAQASSLPQSGSPQSDPAMTAPDSAVPEDPAVLLGLDPAQAIARFGPPSSVFAVRGTEAWQDDVVFDYGNGFSLFLFMDRVWQVRIAEPYARPVLGFIVGSTKERAASALGAPAMELAGSCEWVLPGEAWPVRLRGIVDASGAIHELYVYRADF